MSMGLVPYELLKLLRVTLFIPAHDHQSVKKVSMYCGLGNSPCKMTNFVLFSFSLQVDGGSLNVHINLSGLDGSSNVASTPSSTGAAPNAVDTGSAQPQGQPPVGASQGSRGMANTVTEAAQRLAQAKRNFALAENAITRLQVGGIDDSDVMPLS